MIQKLRRSVQDAYDILKHVRDPREGLKALIPAPKLKKHILNLGDTHESEQSPTTVVAGLRRLCNRIKGEAIDATGKVNYQQLKDAEIAQEIAQTSRALRQINLEQLHDDDQKNAFWINLYNVLSIHGVLARGIRNSVMEIPTFFGTTAYQVGPFVLTLDDIENGVLRCNGAHPASKRLPFPPGSAQLTLCPDNVDPRIHAALVCASTSCPPVSFYDTALLDQQLTLAAQNYVINEVQARHDTQQLMMPITLLYYAADFGSREGIRDFILSHAQEKKADLQEAFEKGYRWSYPPYDWSLNAMSGIPT